MQARDARSASEVYVLVLQRYFVRTIWRNLS
jgi:hypothetical protein